MSSGARYQRVTTCVVICRVSWGHPIFWKAEMDEDEDERESGCARSVASLMSQSSSSTTRARPKSQIFTCAQRPRGKWALRRSRAVGEDRNSGDQRLDPAGVKGQCACANIAGAGEQDIGWLEVAMQHVRRV